MADEGRKRKSASDKSDGVLNTFEWEIGKYQQGFVNISDNEEVTSPIFVGKSVDLPITFWQIKVCPKVEVGEVSNVCCVFLVFNQELNAFNPVVRVKCEFSLLDRNQKEICAVGDETVYEYRAGHSGLEFTAGETHSEMFDPKNGYLEDDVLRIRIKVWIQNEETNAAASKKPRTDQLHKDLSQLLETSQCSDLDILVGDSTLKAHKAILSCRSPVFAAMFKNEMAESLTSSVNIEDFSEKTVKGMLQFIYSGNLESVDEDFMELFKIAEKYELGELKALCVKTAITKTSTANAVELLIIGDMHNAPELKYRTMAFINSNKAQGIPNGDFEKLAKEHPLLLLELYQNGRNTNGEVTRFVTNLKD